MSLTLFKMHTEALEHSVRGHGLELYDAGGEGDCQFKALHHQLASRKLVRDDDTNSFNHQTVRQLAVVGMEEFNAGARETALAEYTATHPGNEACTYDEFLKRMRRPGAVWGANASLEGAARQLASQVLQRPVRIRVHKEHGEPMLVTSWGDGQDPAEDTVVTLNLALLGETHYYSTVAPGDARETNKRRREDDEGGKIGSKRVSLGVGGEEDIVGRDNLELVETLVDGNCRLGHSKKRGRLDGEDGGSGSKRAALGSEQDRGSTIPVVPGTPPRAFATSRELATYLRQYRIDELVTMVNASSLSDVSTIKGRVGEYLGAAWYLFRENDSNLRAYLLDRGDPASIPKELEEQLGKKHHWFCKVRPSNDLTARLFDVVVVEGHGKDSAIHALLSCKWCTGVDAWHGKLSRKVNNSWGDEEKKAFLCTPLYLFQVVPEQGQSGNQTARVVVGKPEESLDWQQDVECEEDEGTELFCAWLDRLSSDQARTDQAPVSRRTPRGWQRAACDTIMGHVHAAAPEGRVVAGDVVAATGSGKTDIVTMTLAALFTAVRGSRVCVVLIETLEGAGKLLATLARLDANMYFLNSSKTGGGDYKDDRVNKINVSCDSKSGWVTRDKKTTEAIEQLQRMATGDRPSVIVCLYQSARILLQLQCLSGVVFCARIMDEVHTVARSVGWSACHFLSTSHLILGLTATAVPSQCRGRSVLAIDEADCIEMNIAKSTDELRELPVASVASVASVATQVGVVEGGGLPIQRDEQYKALLGYMAKRFSTIGSWMNGPCCFRPAPNFNRKEWTGRVLEQGDKYLWQAGDDIWVPVPKYDKDEVASEQRGQDVYELQIQVEPLDIPEAGAEPTDNGRVAALVKDASGRGMRWIVGEMQSMRDWINTNLCSDEEDGPVKSDFGTYLTREAPHFGDMPFQRPVLFALPKPQSDELDYTVPPVIDVPYMDRSALQDQRLKDKLDAVEESGKVTLPTGTKVSAEDFYNAQALRKRFERSGFNTYPRYHGLPSHHILVQCSTSCSQVDRVHDLLSHALGGLEVDGESIVVEKAHSKINGGDGGMTKELRNKKALDNFKNGRFGVLVVCEMFVQGADFPELDEVFPWNSNLDNEMANVQLGGRASRKVEGGSKERYGFQLGIQYLEEEDDGDGDDDGMDNDNGAPTPESFFACLTKDGVQLYTQLAAAFGENVKFRVRYTRKKKKKKDVTEEEGEADDMEVDDGGFVSTTFTEMDIAAIRALVGVDRFDGEPFSSKLEKWKAELEKGDEWVRSPDGTRPKGVINMEASRTHRPYQRKVSMKVYRLLANRMTKHGWDHYEKMNAHDLCVFHAFVSRELGWDFQAEWLDRKEKHDAERADPTPKGTFADELEEWKAELEKGDEWVGSPDGTRPKGVINERASMTHRPYQRKVSMKVYTLLGNQMTKHGWDHYEKMNAHDLCVFHAFVSRELGWDFQAEWLQVKKKHDAERADPTPKETFADELKEWKAELEKGDEWVGSPDGTRPKGVINPRASRTHRPYQRKVSMRVKTLLANQMTKHGWDHYEKMKNGHDLCVFHEFVSRELGWDFKAEWLQMKKKHDAERADPTPKETFADKLKEWKAELEKGDEWVGSPDGTRPKGVINERASMTDRPYQRKVSTRVKTLLGNRMTKHGWDHYEKMKNGHDLCVFHAFVLGELGWDFKAEWLQMKKKHDAERADQTPKETFADELKEWKAELEKGDEWVGSPDGTRPKGVINSRASMTDRPYQRKVSMKVYNLLGNQMTKHGWDHYEKMKNAHDLCVFHAFVLGELGWDFKAEWLQMKKKHDAKGGPDEELGR